MTASHPSLTDIRPDAIHYTPAIAESLYVTHPSGLPTPDRNSLVVGPLGSGKTIMLKALLAKWTQLSQLRPIYVDLLRWTSQLAGETETYSSDRLSPRGRAILGGMSLAINVALCESLGAFETPTDFPSSWRLFDEAFGTSDPAAIRNRAKAAIREALLTGRELPATLPSTFTMAGALGADTRSRHGSLLVLMIDQIDQVSAPFFSPVATLLRRSADFVSILATRPCATAPEPEEIPPDIVSGDHYRLIQLGRSPDGELPEGFVRSFLNALPLSAPLRGPIQNRAGLICSLMWPSLRYAVNTILEYARLIESGRPDESAWDEAVREIAKTYEDMVQDGIRAFCPNPRTMLGDWRNEFIAVRDGAVIPIGRGLLRFADTDLLGEIPNKTGQALIRVALKRGVLFVSATEHYIPGTLPTACEISPLAMVNDSRIDLQIFDNTPVTIVVGRERLLRWSKPFAAPHRTSKRIFISLWMSDPLGQRRLEEIVRARFGSIADVRTGALTGSPRWSPEIIERVGGVDLVLCDLTVPRRDVFVEYGVAIGVQIPVLQCLATQDSESDLPAWVRARQNQYFLSTDIHSELFDTSILGVLDNDADLKASWKRDSSGKSLEKAPEPRRVVLVVPEGSAETFRPLHSPLREEGFIIQQMVSSANDDVLEDTIRAVRSAGTLVLAFDGSDKDYLTCTAGGVFATRQRAAGARKFDRRFFVLSLARDPSRVPGLLGTHPQGAVFMDLPELRTSLGARLRRLPTTLAQFERS